MPKIGFRFSQQSKEKMRLSHLGKKLSLKTRKKMSLSSHHFTTTKGKPLSEEHKQKIRLSSLGRKLSEEWKHNISVHHRNEVNHNWKGDNVGRYALHEWVILRLGKPRLCARCGTTTAKIYDWSNNSGLYKRDLLDWERLCRKCHMKKDNKFHNRYYPK